MFQTNSPKKAARDERDEYTMIFMLSADVAPTISAAAIAANILII
jgi:hypothetical protein